MQEQFIREENVTTLRSLLPLALIASSAFGITSYTGSVSAVTSVTVPNSTHGLGSANFGVRVYDAGNVLQDTSTYSYSINSSTYAVTITWSSAFTGSYKLTGVFSALTTASSDFATTVPNNYTVTVCASCTAGSPAVRNYGGLTYASVSSAGLTFGDGTANGTVYVFVDKGLVVFGFSGSSFATACHPTTSYGDAQIRYGASGFPAGTLPLAHVGYTSCSLGGATDDRPFI